MGRPWYAFYAADYANKTKWFTSAAQHGIYRAILDVANIDGPPDDNEEELRALTRATEEEWARYWPRIRERFFEALDGKLVNRRAEEERGGFQRGQSKRHKAAKGAADARWKGEQRSDARQAIEAYNKLAARVGIPECQHATDKRLAAIRRRLGECGGLGGWHAALAKLEASSFCRGGGPRGWKASVDFLCQASSFTKLMEGYYDDRTPGGGRPKRDIKREVLRGVGLGDLVDGGAAPGEDMGGLFGTDDSAEGRK